MNIAAMLPISCTKCTGCSVHNRAVCRVASADAVAEINRISRLRRFKAGEVILAKGDDAGIVGNVVEGIVKLENDAADGTQQIVGLLYPSDFFGRVFADEVRYSYQAATDVTLCCMERRSFEGILARHPRIEHELLVTTLNELDAMRDWAAMVGGRTTMQRVATFLYILARRSINQTCAGAGEPPRLLITIPLNRRDLAAYLGTTRETLSRNIQSLARSGVIQIFDAFHMEVMDEDALADMAGYPEDCLLGGTVVEELETTGS